MRPGETVPGESTSAGKLLNWGEPNRVDTFDGTALKSDWNVYDGVGHAGNGRRTPDAFSVKDGIMTITGDSAGSTGGMAWNPGQKYGRWEGRVKAPASDESYNALLLLWPDAENFPVGGEIDFMEMTDHTRQSTNMFLHYGRDNKQVQGDVKIDATEWHNWAVEWTPTHVAAFVDGKEWWRTTERSILPPGPMHLCIQLDWFPKGGDVQESHMYVDWVKQYALSPGDIAEGAVDDAAQLADDAIAEAGSLPRAAAGAASGVAGAAAGRATEGVPAAGAVAGVTGRVVEGGPDPVPGPVPDPSGALRGAGLVPNPVRSDG
ncbi:glycoside hydrolase family 16 protein [Pseudonocardia sp. T1-2H]|uniref:glycoside hydrolase family 16 protein n=1 Tax=Pseudonocardia sp. T1-2H TaxID=3128899 RepID=UPI003100D8D3